MSSDPATLIAEQRALGVSNSAIVRKLRETFGPSSIAEAKEHLVRYDHGMSLSDYQGDVVAIHSGGA